MTAGEGVEQTAPEIPPDEFAQGFGETLQQALDVDSWRSGEDLSEVYRRIDEEVREAVRQEESYARLIRQEIFPALGSYPSAPKGAGVYAAAPGDVRRIHHGLLFNGGVEAADGRILAHDTLPLTVFQVGVSLVSYQGHQGVWGHRLYRRDLRISESDPLGSLIHLLERRERRDGLNVQGGRDALARLARRGILAYAERAILFRRASASWRLGHGNPAPFELITGSGSLDLMIEATRLVRDAVEETPRFLFVASEPSDRFLLSIGNALRPLEFAIVRTLKESVEDIVANVYFADRRHSADTTWGGAHLTPLEWIARFRDEVAPRIVVGVYRATQLSAPQVFYAHEDFADVAAHIALADSVLQAHRGFPLLIDLADSVCRGAFGRETLEAPLDTAYVKAGAPYRYISERQSRYR
jgi:hypothetical protein